MSLLTGSMRFHLDGHKHDTDAIAVFHLPEPDTIAIPLVNGKAPCTPCVKVGDEVQIGTKIAERNDHFYLPLFSSISGTVTAIEKRLTGSRVNADHLIITSDHKDLKVRSFAPIDWKAASREELLDFVKNAGILGCGGAAFPSYVKYQNPKDVQLLIINAVECEPYLTSDYKTAGEQMELLKTGVQAFLKLSTSKKGCIAIKEDKKELIQKLEQAFAGVDGIEIAKVPDMYPMGWERELVYELTKKRYDKLPIEAGCIVSNVTTAVALGNAITNGMPITEKIVTVSGDGVKKPQNVKCPVGTSAHDIVAACGGYTTEDVLLIAGGPMMGMTIPNDTFVIGPQSNGLTILKHREVFSVKCLRCGRCTEVCPAGLQPVRINMSEKIHDIDTLKKLDVNSCIECGLCTYICPSQLDVTEGIRKAKRYMALVEKK